MANIWFSNVHCTPLGMSRNSTHAQKTKLFVFGSICTFSHPPSLVAADGQRLPHHWQSAYDWGQDKSFLCSFQSPTSTGMAEWQYWDETVYYIKWTSRVTWGHRMGFCLDTWRHLDFLCDTATLFKRLQWCPQLFQAPLGHAPQAKHISPSLFRPFTNHFPKLTANVSVLYRSSQLCFFPQADASPSLSLLPEGLAADPVPKFSWDLPVPKLDCLMMSLVGLESLTRTFQEWRVT